MILTGDLEAISAVNLVVPVTPTGMLSIRWLVEDGAMVKQGDRLVEFDTTAFTGTLDDKRLAVQRAENDRIAEEAKAVTARAEKDLDVHRRRAELDKARIEAGVPAELYPPRVYQEKQLAVAQKEDDLAKAEDDRTVANRSAQFEMTVKDVVLARARRELADLERRLKDLALIAPRNGMVQVGLNPQEGRRYVLGDQAFAGWSVVSLPDAAAMQVHARLSDVDDGAVRAGMRADCVLDAFPTRQFAGTVKSVSPTARLDGRDGLRQAFDALVVLDDPDAKIMRPGMSTRVSVLRRRIDDGLLVPRAALSATSGTVPLLQENGGESSVAIEFCTEDMCAVRGSIPAGVNLAPAKRPGAS